jgi:hypothetical protein
MSSLDDWARFRAEDPVELVVASFCCPWCLRRAQMVFLEEECGEYSAACRCGICSSWWRVVMTERQFLRATLLPLREFVMLGSPHFDRQTSWPFGL